MDKEMSALRDQLSTTEQQKQQLTNKVDNQALATNRNQLQAQQNASQVQGVADVQLQQLEKMVDKYKKECEGRFIIGEAITKSQGYEVIISVPTPRFMSMLMMTCQYWKQGTSLCICYDTESTES